MVGRELMLTSRERQTLGQRPGPDAARRRAVVLCQSIIERNIMPPLTLGGRLTHPMAGFDDRLFQFGAFVADPVTGNLHRDGAVPLSVKTFEVLIVLLEHRGTVVEKDALLKLIWPDTVVEENTLARHTSTLRKR